MTWLTESGRYVVFAMLAVVTNTAFPYPFEPVLLLFAEGATPSDLILLSVTGSIAAGIAALIDHRLLSALGHKLFAARVRNFHRWWFYAAVFATALLPFPYTATRAALLRGRPNAVLFAGTVTAARFPRYLLTVHLWQVLTPPRWVTVTLVAAGVIVAILSLHHRTVRRGTDAVEEREQMIAPGPLMADESDGPRCGVADSWGGVDRPRRRRAHSLRTIIRGSAAVARRAGR